jgi:hypothetical protein
MQPAPSRYSDLAMAANVLDKNRQIKEDSILFTKVQLKSGLTFYEFPASTGLTMANSNIRCYLCKDKAISICKCGVHACEKCVVASNDCGACVYASLNPSGDPSNPESST